MDTTTKTQAQGQCLASLRISIDQANAEVKDIEMSREVLKKREELLAAELALVSSRVAYAIDRISNQ